MDPLADNPFFILELPTDASAMDVERAGKKLLGMLDLELAQAQTYPTPYGPRARTPEMVRDAVRTLLDPQRRLAMEPWAQAPRQAPVCEAGIPPWDGAMSAPWWSWRCRRVADGEQTP